MPKISNKEFLDVVRLTPLISIDLLVVKGDKYLIGHRSIDPAKGTWFVPGGRIFKNEKMAEALRRICIGELGISFSIYETQFQGIFEHHHPNNFLNDSTGTHYIVICLKLLVDSISDLPKIQHNSYRWLTEKEIIDDSNVHPFVKDYFTMNNSYFQDHTD